jgi:Carboxypeptidase regulatory-like domain
MGKPLGAIIVGLLLLLPTETTRATTCIAPPPLKPIHRICGFVNNQLGEPIPNAKVTVLQNGSEIVTVQTSTDGRFSFEQLKAGHYDIQVQATGYKPAFSSIILVKPDITRCRRELNVLLPVGMSCSGISLVKPKKIK